MVGTNKMMLNDATIRAALQEYFDKRYSEGIAAGPRVVTLAYVYDSTGGLNHWQVTLEGKTV